MGQICPPHGKIEFRNRPGIIGLKIISFIQYIVLTLFFTQVFLHALRQKVKEVENMSVAIQDDTVTRRKSLIICLEKGFILAALVFFVSFWAIAFHNVYASSVFAFSCDFKKNT